MKNALSEMQVVLKRERDMQGWPILFVGNQEDGSLLKSRFENHAELSMQVLVCREIDEGLALLSSNPTIALVVLLWGNESAEGLPDQLRSVMKHQSNPMLACMVRSKFPLSEQIRTSLWQLGAADHSFEQSILSAEFADSVLLAMRNYRRQYALHEIPALSGVLSGAKNMRDLACLSLAAIEDTLPAVQGGAFCYLGNSAEHRPMMIAGTGCHENYSCVPLQQMDDALAKRMIHTALYQCCSQYCAEGAAYYLRTPDGYTVCLYLSLKVALSAFEISVLQSIGSLIATAIDQSQLEQRLLRTQHATITGMSAIAEYRDTDTGDHIARVARLTTEISQILYVATDADKEVDEQFMASVGLASTLHDTGKVAITDNILLKPGPLDQNERFLMEQHVTLGYDLLIRAARQTDNGELLKMSAEIARYHHERFDGNGYPDGLKGEKIPLAARIVAVVDVYDALTCKRPYKLAWEHEKAMTLIRNESGKHFDPKVVQAFERLNEIKLANRHIEWQEGMSVNHDDLDDDHQLLMEIINRLWVAETMGNRQIIEFVLDDLVHYTEFHFLREEQLMEQVDYPERERHGAIHKSICSHLEEIRWEYFEGIRDDLRSGLLVFVTSWLNKHILEEDMRYSHYFDEMAKVRSLNQSR